LSTERKQQPISSATSRFPPNIEVSPVGVSGVFILVISPYVKNAANQRRHEWSMINYVRGAMMPIAKNSIDFRKTQIAT
jgi:hypothetical protein